MASSRAHKMAKGQFASGGAVGRAMRTMRRHYADGGDVVKERAMFLPLGTYGDGTTRAAWPGLLYEPAAAWKRMMDSGYRPGDAENTRKMAEDSFTVAGAVPVAGLAAAAVRPGTSLGSGGGRIKGYHGTERAERIGQDKPERMWMTGDRTSQSTDAANSYAYGMGHRDVPAVYKVEGRFQNPLEVEGGGNHFQFIEFDGRKYGADSLADEAARRGHDALVVKNVKDHASSYENTPNITSVAALRPGTVYDDYGNLLFSNSSKASAPGLGALEANRVRRIPDHAMREYRQAQDYLDKSPTGRIANQMQMLVDEYWKYNPDGAPPPSAAEHQAQVSRMFSPDTRPAPAPKAFEDTLEVRPVDSRQLHDIASANYDDYAIKSKVEMAPIETLQGQYHWDKKVGPLADEIANNGWFEPIIVDQNGVVIEGQHRLRAMQKLGAKRIPVQRIIGHD